jgi:hypothetical protein
MVGHSFTVNGQNVTFPGRYGYAEQGAQMSLYNSPMPTAGRAGWMDFLTQISLSGWPDRANQFPFTKFALPADLRSRYGVGQNVFGQPVFQATLQSEITNANGALVTDSPYELNLSRSAVSGMTGSVVPSSLPTWAADMPFSVAELERVLRVYDADSGKLPERLLWLAGIQDPTTPGGGDLSDARKITTDSNDLPAPNVELPAPLASFMAPPGPNAPTRLPRSTAELLEMRVRVALRNNPKKYRTNGSSNDYPLFPVPFATTNGPAAANDVRGVVRQLLSPDLADGLRLNINRPFGNGIDDNQPNQPGYGVVDEQTIVADNNKDGDIDQNEMMSEETSVWKLNANDPNAAAASAVKAAGQGAQPYLNGSTTAPVFPAMAQVPARVDSQSNKPFKTGVDANGQMQPQQDGNYLENADHRQLMARYLYVLALTLTADAQYGLTTNTADQKYKDDAELARRTAQWAVNAVDFRDADNDMTAFEYDVNPFDGWDVDGIVGFNSPDDTNTQIRGLVWGAERPELLMTETLAWHDRRTDNTASAEVYRSPAGGSQGANNQDTVKNKQTPTDPKSDADYDSLTRPKGAFFLELYNPWPSAPGVGGGLHAMATTSRSPNNPVDTGVNLALVSQGWPLNSRQPTVTGSPVWRLAVYKRGAVAEDQAYLWDPDDTDQVKKQKAFPLLMDRSVYFAGFDPQFQDDGVAFFNNINGAKGPVNLVQPVRPGRYMVIGSGDNKGNGVYESQLGDRKGARNPATANRNKLRCVQLVTKASNPMHSVSLLDATHTAGNQDAPQSAISDITVNNMYRTMAPTEASIIQPQNGNPAIGDRAFPGDNSNCVADVAIIDQVFDGTQNQNRRLTLSEPAIGYPNKFRGSIWNPDKDEYDSADKTVLGIDVPLDGPIGGETALGTQFPGGPQNWPSYLARFDATTRKWISQVDPVLCTMRDSNATGGTSRDLGASYSFIYLQRLANPRLPYNPEPGKQGHDAMRPVNPYLTVDNTSANLTVFNSRGDSKGLEENDYDSNKAGTQFTSHERGYAQWYLYNKINPQLSFVSQPPSTWTDELPSGVLPDRTSPTLKMPLLATPKNPFYAGMANIRQMSLADSGNFWFNRVPFCTLGYMNRPFDNPKLTGEQRQVAPRAPFSWLAWNNRPYLSAKELLLVPRTRSSQLLKQFFTAEPVTGNKPHPSSYQTQLVSEFIKPQPTQDQQPAFTYLENFFYERPASAPAQPNRQIPSALYRIFEYIQTPSLFTGTSTWLNPTASNNPNTNPAGFGTPLNATLNTAPYDPRLNREPPFNSISEFRDPGRVNLNTITAPDVYAGLFQATQVAQISPAANQPVHPGPTWNTAASQNARSFLDARQGYPNSTGSIDPLTLNANLPTILANPFRSPDAGDLVPLPNMMRSGADCTLLRSVQGTAGTGQGAGQTNGDPTFAALTNAPFDDSTRSASFRYGPMIRLDNLTTTRSNVYAVWVTIGFFEVEPAPAYSPRGDTSFGSQAMYNRVYPDGYALGREAGLDTGENRRLRGFYIIDRSMPAGFEPGSDLNVENTIRLKRRIQ